MAHSTGSIYLSHPLYGLGELYLLVLLLRAVFSWIPVSPGGFMAGVNRLLYTLTEPVLAPFRRIIPPLGMFDMSFLVVMVLVWLVTNYLLFRVVV